MVDRETLKAFVEAAAAEAAAQIAAAEDAYAFFDANFRPEGPWRQGEIYLFAHHLDGIQFFHALTPETEGLDRSELEDVNGVKFLQEILAAVASGGGYVEYRWPNPEVEGDEDTGSPKVSYAVPLTIGDLELSLGAGIYVPVTASDVLNRGNLQQFVERAAEALSEHAADRETAHAFLDANFRAEGEWRHLDIYVFVLTMEGINFFQAPDPDWEGTDVSDLEDLNGVSWARNSSRRLARAGDSWSIVGQPGSRGRRGARIAQTGLRGSDHRRRRADAPRIGDLPGHVGAVAARFLRVGVACAGTRRCKRSRGGRRRAGATVLPWRARAR